MVAKRSLAEAKRFNLHVCMHLQVETRRLSSRLHSRRLAASGAPAQPATDSDSPTWTLPGLDQVSAYTGVSKVLLPLLCIVMRAPASGA